MNYEKLTHREPVLLAHLPTPLYRLDRLSEVLGGPEIWIKRDDATGVGMGGNKVRKLQYLLAEAREQSATALLTAGPLQSNHCRQTAAVAAAAGLDCILVIEDRVRDADALYRTNGNLLLDRLFGARFVVLDGGANLEAALEQQARKVREQGGVPYVIPVGASSALGALGYVDCAAEIAGQTDFTFDHWIHATGSGGTQAGLVAGAEWHHLNVQILGINILDVPAAQVAHRIRTIADEVLLNAGHVSTEKHDVTVLDGYVGEAFGKPTEGMIEAVSLLGRTEGLVLDPVHTGKAMAGLIDQVRKGRFASGERLLFIHTGGLPSTFAYAPLWSLEAVTTNF